MKKLLRRSKAAKHLFHLALVFSFLLLGTTSSWAIVVTTLADSGSGSLRAAIATANGDGVATTITFDPVVFPAAAPATIFLISQLPALTGQGDTIDGTGSGVILDGSTISTPSDDVGIRIRASNITIRGLTTQNFPSDGVRIEPAGGASGVTITGVLITQNIIVNNFDGLRVSGQTGINNVLGVSITNNEFSQNRDDGIFVRGSSGNGDPTTPAFSNGNTVEVLIDGNTIRGSRGEATGGVTTGDGIRVLGGNNNGSGNTVRATISNNNTWDNADDGILVAGAGFEGAASDNVVEVEIVHNNVRGPVKRAEEGKGRGITIRGGNRSFGDPVFTGAGNQITFIVTNNKITRFRDSGVFIGGGLGSSHILSGDVLGNDVNKIGDEILGTGTGIQLTGSAGVSNTLEDIDVQGNKVSGSVEDGILVSGGPGGNATLSNINLDGNTSGSNGRDGIRVVEGVLSNVVSVAGITGNITNSNVQDGIFVGTGVLGSGTTPISENRSDRNGEDGIDIDSTGYVLSNNRASRNTVDGINAAGNVDGGGNIATGNASCNTPGCF